MYSRQYRLCQSSLFGEVLNQGLELVSDFRLFIDFCLERSKNFGVDEGGTG